MSAEEQEAAQQAKVAVSKQLAKLEVAHPCDNNLPTPCPQSESQHSSTTLSQTNSWADISALVAQQRCAEKEVAGRPAAGNIAAGRSTAGGTTEPSGWLFTNDGLIDEEDHQVLVKKFRRVVVPDPVTPVAAKARRPTVVQKQDVERANEEAKAKKAAEREAKA